MSQFLTFNVHDVSVLKLVCIGSNFGRYGQAPLYCTFINTGLSSHRVFKFIALLSSFHNSLRQFLSHLHRKSKIAPPLNFLRHFHLWRTCVVENSLMLPNHIPTCVLILVHLSEYFINCITFTTNTLQILTTQCSLLWNSLNFLVKTNHIIWHLISGVTRVGVTWAATEGVTHIFFLKKTYDLFAHHCHLYWFHSGDTLFTCPTSFVHCSLQICPQFFFVRVSSPGGCHPGRSA